MHSNSNGSTGFLGKMSFVGKTVGLNLHCTVAVSRKWLISKQDELDWNAAGVMCSDISQSRIDHIHATSFPIPFQWKDPVPQRNSILR